MSSSNSADSISKSASSALKSVSDTVAEGAKHVRRLTD